MNSAEADHIVHLERQIESLLARIDATRRQTAQDALDAIELSIADHRNSVESEHLGSGTTIASHYYGVGVGLRVALHAVRKSAGDTGIPSAAARITELEKQLDDTLDVSVGLIQAIRELDTLDHVTAEMRIHYLAENLKLPGECLDDSDIETPQLVAPTVLPVAPNLGATSGVEPDPERWDDINPKTGRPWGPDEPSTADALNALGFAGQTNWRDLPGDSGEAIAVVDHRP